MRVKAEIEPALKAWQTQNRSPKADVSYITSSAVFIEAPFSFHSYTGRTFKSQWQTAMWSAAATAAADNDGDVFFFDNIRSHNAEGIKTMVSFRRAGYGLKLRIKMVEDFFYWPRLCTNAGSIIKKTYPLLIMHVPFSYHLCNLWNSKACLHGSGNLR